MPLFLFDIHAKSMLKVPCELRSYYWNSQVSANHSPTRKLIIMRFCSLVRSALIVPALFVLVPASQAQVRLFKAPDAAAQSGVVTRTDPASVTPIETRAVDIDPAAQRALSTATTGSTVFLDMLPGKNFTAVLERLYTNADEPQAYTWTGQITGHPDAQFALSTYNSVTVAHVALPDGDVFSITYDGDGTHRVTKSHPELNHFCGVDDHLHPPMAPPLVPPVNGSSATTSDPGSSGGIAPRADSPDQVDILMAYTPRIREINGGEDAMQALINMCFAYSNQAFINSGLTNFSIVKAGTIEINYTSVIPEVPGGADGGSIQTELESLQIQGDGLLDIVHPLRDGIQADLVHLFVPAFAPGTVGLAYVLSGPGGGSYAFGVSSGVLNPYRVCYVVAHELGHNYGLGHDMGSDNIMSYSSNTVPYFSAAQVLSIQGNANNLANFRQRQTPAPRLHSEVPSVTANARMGAVAHETHEIFNIGKGALNFTVTENEPWLSIFPPAGQISDTGTRSTEITLNFDSTGLAAGSYSTLIAINGAPNGPLEIPVTFNVIADAPPNDQFANATELTTAFGSLFDSNVNATLVPFESWLHSGANSVWYKWTATSNDPLTIDTEGSSFDTILGVWTGTWGTLDLVQINDNISAVPPNLQSRITFTPVAGTTYSFCVAGNGSAAIQSGSIRLNWGDNPPPANDNFVDAQTLSGVSGSVHSNTFFASIEPNDPASVDGAAINNSVWYRWTAPWNGTVQLSTLNSPIDTVLGVYTGTPGALTTVAENDDSGASSHSEVAFLCEGGTTYYILVAGANSGKGPVLLTWSATVAVEPVLHANPASITAETHMGIDVTPTHLRIKNVGVGSLDYSVSVDANWLHVFTITDATAGLGMENSHPVYFDTDALPVGTHTATITVTSAEAENSPFTIPVSVTITSDTVPPPNDNFINAIPVEGKSGVAYASGKSATIEGYSIRGVQDSYFTNSVWFKWETSEPFPPMSTVTFDANGSGYNPPTMLLMTSRNEPFSFDMLVDSIQPGAAGVPRSFHAHYDTPYYVYLSRTNNPMQLRWGSNLPENDNFHDATIITGLSGNETADTTEATRQSAEPAKISGQEASHSVWYSWTAPSNGTTWFNTIGSNFDTLLAVYTGAFSSLEVVGENDNFPSATLGESSVEVEHTEGTTYFVRVDGANFETGDAVLNWSQESTVSDWYLY